MDKIVALERFESDISGIGGDISTVRIDSSENVNKRVTHYIEQIHNPYCFKCDNTLVRVAFNPTGNNLESSIIKYFSRIQEI